MFTSSIISAVTPVTLPLIRLEPTVYHRTVAQAVLWVVIFQERGYNQAMDTLMIHERTVKYQLPDDEKSALDRLLYEKQAGILKVEELAHKAKKFVEDAATCRGTGLQNLDERIANVLKHFRLYNQEYSIANIRNAVAGAKPKTKRK